MANSVAQQSLTVEILTIISSIIDALAWPSVFCLAFFVLRKPLLDLLRSITQLSYKGLRVSLLKQAERARESLPLVEDGLDSAEKEKITSEPRIAVLDAWTNLERTVVKKYRQLTRTDVTLGVEPNKALAFFEYTSALTPTAQRTMSDLKFLRNQIAHSNGDVVTMETATAYVGATKSLCRQIDVMDSTPSLDLILLTTLILQYNKLVDHGVCDDITIDEIHSHIKAGTVLNFIKERAGSNVDLSLQLMATADEQSFEQYYAKYLRSIYETYKGNEQRKWGIENKGLCLLIAWTNEIIQQGGGWVPDNDVAGLHD